MMSEFDRRRIEEPDRCTHGSCKAKGEVSCTDVDEPHGEKLFLCHYHYCQYMQELNDEIEQYEYEFERSFY